MSEERESERGGEKKMRGSEKKTWFVYVLTIVTMHHAVSVCLCMKMYVVCMLVYCAHACVSVSACLSIVPRVYQDSSNPPHKRPTAATRFHVRLAAQFHSSTALDLPTSMGIQEAPQP